MSRTCIVAADAKRARFFSVEESAAPRDRVILVEQATLVNPDIEGARANGAGRVKTERVSNRQAGDVHPIEPRRQQHRMELERRFGREIARQAGDLTASWSDGTVMLIAEPRMLGIVRAYLREALPNAITLKELAKDYAQLTASELREQLGPEHLA